MDWFDVHLFEVLLREVPQVFNVSKTNCMEDAKGVDERLAFETLKEVVGLGSLLLLLRCWSF